jgi:hypothetical protein
MAFGRGKKLKSDQCLKIHPYDRARYLVEAETAGEEPYLVDLLEYRLNGWCDCRHFAIEIQHVWESGKTPKVKACKHIRAAWSYIVDQALRLAGKGKRILVANQEQRIAIRNRILLEWERIEATAKANPAHYGT